MQYGLTEDELGQLRYIFTVFPLIEKVILYGSRAKGNYRPGSDIDITLVGKDLTLETIYRLDEAIDGLNLPYMFDISILAGIDNEDLLDHINRVGKTLYQREEA